MLPFQLIIACLPLAVFFDSDAFVGALLIAIGVATAASRHSIPQTKESLFRSALTPLLLVLSVPAGYLLFQLLPLSPISHPAWQSAANALSVRLSRGITLDEGATVLVLAKFFAFSGVLILTLMTAMTHARAQRVFIATLCSLTSALAVSLLIGHRLSAAPQSPNYSADTTFLACTGLILCCVLAITLMDRSKSEKHYRSLLSQWLLLGISASIDVVSLGGLAKTRTFIALGLAASTLLLIVLIRRLGAWAGGALAATVCVIGVMLAGNGNTITSNLDSTLRFGSPPASELAPVERMLEDAPLFGTGGGTFDKVYQLYGVLDAPDDRAIFSTPMSAVIAIEFGRYSFWAGIVSIMFATFYFLVRAVMRGRDWLYPAACASMLSLLIPLSFSTALRAKLPVLIPTAAILGLGIAQSRSRHTDP